MVRLSEKICSKSYIYHREVINLTLRAVVLPFLNSMQDLLFCIYQKIIIIWYLFKKVYSVQTNGGKGVGRNIRSLEFPCESIYNWAREHILYFAWRLLLYSLLSHCKWQYSFFLVYLFRFSQLNKKTTSDHALEWFLETNGQWTSR